ncbi:MAG: response regulator [Acidobacteria bacterium]|jgi:DNA-binding response OmpR family regulator|nr:response regulator [Acidobacteriota bacterium]
MQTVLVCDDNQDIREMASFILKEDGFGVIEAARGHAVLPMVIQHKPDVVLLDIRLPDIDGYEVLSSLNALPSGDRPIVIVFSAKSAAEDVAMARSLGASEFVEKPFTVDGLLFAVRRQASRSLLRRSG